MVIMAFTLLKKRWGNELRSIWSCGLIFPRPTARMTLEATINYVEVYGVIKRIVEDGAYNLIEGIATAIVQELLEKFPLNSVTVRVRKPQPPVGGLMDAVEYELTESALVREGK